MLRNLFWKSKSVDVERSIEEYVPTMIPNNITAENPRNTSPPKINIARTANAVVKLVKTVL